MNKWMNIGVALFISLFVALNCYLLFDEKSTISKSVYVSSYERMTAGSFQKELAKEALLAPTEKVTLYVGKEDAIETWNVTEGDPIQVGDELASYNIEAAHEQVETWRAERDALLRQAAEIEATISQLQIERSQAASTSSSKVDRTDQSSETEDGVTVEIDLDIQVDVSQDGAFAYAISEAEQQLAAIEQELYVVEAKLKQELRRSTLSSPVDGFVANIYREGQAPAIEIYPSTQMILTYAIDDEWLEMKVGQPVRIQGVGLNEVLNGSIDSIAKVPAAENEWLTAYRNLEPVEYRNEMATYEVRILLEEEELVDIPFGHHLNAIITLEEVANAVTVRESWLVDRMDEAGVAFVMDEKGRVAKRSISTPFSLINRAIITDGLEEGDLVIQLDSLPPEAEVQRLFLPMPLDWPTKGAWQAFGWKNFIKYMLLP